MLIKIYCAPPMSKLPWKKQSMIAYLPSRSLQSNRSLSSCVIKQENIKTKYGRNPTTSEKRKPIFSCSEPRKPPREVIAE